MRGTMHLTQEHAGLPPFPDTIGQVTDAVTFHTPHKGFTLLEAEVAGPFVCGSCTQWEDMNAFNGNFMRELTSAGLNPQTSGGFTRWTVIGSECDGYVQADNAIGMHASHAVVYAKGSPDSSCYNHFTAIDDQSVKQDAYQHYCDTTNPDNSPCSMDGSDYTGNNWLYTKNGPHALLELYNAVTGRLPSGAERVGSSRRLWLLSTAATAWALLRRSS